MGDRTSQRRSHHFDFRWVIIGIILVVLLAVAVYFNASHHIIDTSHIVSKIDIDNGDTKINWANYDTYAIELFEDLTISKSGIYHLTGNLEDGSITINAGVESVVKLILDNVTIYNSTGPAINCIDGDDLVIELVGSNYLEDATDYSSDYDTDVTGVIYSKADLTFTGNGSLNLIANHQDGIIGKDDLKFGGGTYRITAADDAIRGKDSVYIINGDFTITASADGVKSTNENDYNKGFILIENGNFNITTSSKGIKSTRDIIIYNGNFAIKSTDDAIHSNNYVGIVGGKFNLVSNDDGIHADRTIVIDGGEITIAKSYEGLEAQTVTINNGKVKISSTDDGINAGGGVDMSATSRIGGDAFNADENCILSINGGDIYINASGDGVDSNGWLYFNGGKVAIDGPVNDGNGALDSGLGIVMNGGEVIALGSSGMAESLGASSSVFNVSIFLNEVQPANTSVTIKNSSSDTIVSHTSAKSFSHIAVGSPSFQLGETYTIYLNNEEYQKFTISDITTKIQSSNYLMTPDSNMRPNSRMR